LYIAWRLPGGSFLSEYHRALLSYLFHHDCSDILNAKRRLESEMEDPPEHNGSNEKSSAVAERQIRRGDYGAETELQRHLSTRHVTMIALGSSIGMGLWLGSGKSLASGGPVGECIQVAAFDPVTQADHCLLQAFFSATYSLDQWSGQSVTRSESWLYCTLFLRLSYNGLANSSALPLHFHLAGLIVGLWSPCRCNANR
jgi:hypothetical protein